MHISFPLSSVIALALLIICINIVSISSSETLKASCRLAGTGSRRLSGTLFFEQHTGGLVRVTGDISGIEPAKEGQQKEHGIHIHEWGHIGTSDGKGAGNHYNPHGKKHGVPPDAEERHVGDMGNIIVNDKGSSTFNKTLDLIELRGENSVIGRTVILHAQKDDGTDPAGNAGDRIGQCVIGIANTGQGVVNRATGQAETVSTRQAICELRSDSGKVFGRITFEQPKDADTPVQVRARVCGLDPNSKHGFHIHEYGDLTGTSSITDLVGGHYNPFGKPHGLPGNKERHMGDMGNLVTDKHGSAQYHDVAMDAIMLHGDHSIIGRAVVVHKNEDDGGQPTGNAGEKIATCTIGIIDDYWDAQATPWDVQCNVASRLQWTVGIILAALLATLMAF